MKTKATVVAVVVLLLLDFIWISSNTNMYGKMVQKMQNTTMSVRLYSAIIAYILMIVGLVWVIFPIIDANIKLIKNKVVGALRFGGLFGLVVYGIYNSTNYAIFNDCSLKVAFIDTLWGVTVYSLATYVYLLL